MKKINELYDLLQKDDTAELGPLDFEQRLARTEKENPSPSRYEKMQTLMQDVKSGLESFVQEHHVNWLAQSKDDTKCGDRSFIGLGQYVDSNYVNTQIYVLHSSKSCIASMFAGIYYAGETMYTYDSLVAFELPCKKYRLEYLESACSAISDKGIKSLDKFNIPNRLFSIDMNDAGEEGNYYVMGQRITRYNGSGIIPDDVSKLMKMLVRKHNG